MFLGIDVGTSSLKAVVLDVDGSIVGTGSATYPVTTPQPGWAESDPQAWWHAAGTAVRAATGAHALDVAAGGLRGQMHRGVLRRHPREPLPAGILWAQSRARPQPVALNE